MSVVLYTHPACLGHQPGAGHAERPERLQAVVDGLRDALPALAWREAPRATHEALLRVHHAAHLARLLDDQPDAPRQLDPDTVQGPGSTEAALRAAGAGLAAVDAVMSGEASRAFCAVRPPGHHATADTAMGFCLFNSIAAAASHALHAHGLSRVAVLDFDVHHGNGTQAIFWDEPRVLFASTHQLPLYPGTGAADERGAGNVLNAPLPPGSGSDAFRNAWRGLLAQVDAFAPQLLLVSAGFDAHRLDPLAQLELEADDYAWLTGELVSLAERRCGGRLVSMLEGGYHLDALRECAVAHVRALAA